MKPLKIALIALLIAIIPLVEKEAYSIPFVDIVSMKIDCLIEKESSGNHFAVGDGGKAVGCLQFHLPTWELFCVKKYGLTDKDLRTDCEMAKKCAYKMIVGGYESHWTTNQRCSELISKR